MMFRRLVPLLLLLAAGMLVAPMASSPLASTPKKSPNLRVGIYADRGVGDSPALSHKYAEDVGTTLKSFCPNYKIRLISARDIRKGALKSLDVVIFPGGSGQAQMKSLGKAAGAKVREFVRRGGGYVGICAGAYLARSPLPGSKETVLSLVPAVLTDEGNYWERGSGVLKVLLEEKGKDIFPELSAGSPLYMHYYNGPVLVPAKGKEKSMEVLMTFGSDTIKGDPEASSIKGLPFMIRSRFGKGTVVIVSGHPEATPGLRWVLPRMVSLAGGAALATYPPELTKADKVTGEILYTKEMRKGERLGLEILDNAAAEEEITVLAFMEELHAMLSRKFTHRLPGLLKSPSVAIRGAAAKAVGFYEYFPALSALKKAFAAETDPTVKADMESALGTIHPDHKQ